MKFGWGLISWSIIITVGLFVLAKANPMVGISSPLLFFGQLTSLVGTIFLTWSYFLSARFGWLEKIFGGLDKIYKYHHLVGGLAFVFLINHPLLLAINSLPNQKAVTTYFVLGTNLSYNLGMVALYGLIFVVIATLYIRLPYHIWKTIHEYSGLVVLFGGAHALFINSDISRYIPLRIWMLGMIGLAIAAIGYYRIIYARFRHRYQYTVSGIAKREEVIEIEMIPTNKSLTFSPGQFAFIKFPNLTTDDPHAHPFSISSSPLQKGLRFSIKILGDYTLRLKDLQIGDKALVWGPHGQFLEVLPTTEKAIFIGGGIGITPFLSVLADPKTYPKEITVIYSTSDEKQAVYNDQISSLAESNNFRYHLHNSLILGRLTAKKILELINLDIKKSRFFLCGPSTMMSSLADQLISQGVRPSRILYEDFALV